MKEITKRLKRLEQGILALIQLIHLFAERADEIEGRLAKVEKPTPRKGRPVLDHSA